MESVHEQLSSEIDNITENKTTSIFYTNVLDTNKCLLNKRINNDIGHGINDDIYDSDGYCLTNIIPTNHAKNIFVGDSRIYADIHIPFFGILEYDKTGKLIEKTNEPYENTKKPLNTETKYIRLIIGDVPSLQNLKDRKIYISFDKDYGYTEYGTSKNDETENIVDLSKRFHVINTDVKNGFYNENTFYENEYFRTTKIKCNGNEKYLVTIHLLSVLQFSAGIFLDEEGNYLGKTEPITQDGTFTDIPITTPSDCRYLIVNSRLEVGTDVNHLLVKQELLGFNHVQGKIGFTGDSICYGLAYLDGYAKTVRDNYGITYNNIGVSGGHIAHDRDDIFIISNSIALLDSDIECLIMEGGINDYSNSVPLGEISTDYTTSVDQTTFSGGLEKLFRDSIERFPYIPKAFLIVHRVTDTYFAANSQGLTFKDYIDRIKEICEKYGISVIDIGGRSGFNTYNDTIRLECTDGENHDGLHPNKKGYETYYKPFVVEYLNSVLPMIIDRTN